VTRVGPEVNTVAAGAGKSRCVDQSGLFSSACREISSYREAKTTKGQTIPKRTEPAFFEPMQCKPVTALPAGVKWTFEIKFDGYRCIVVKRRREVTLFSRHKKVLNKRFPSVVEALALLEGDFVLDGAPVALDSQGKPSF
jgi:bifunctional non-homologous end joining protein LigD